MHTQSVRQVSNSNTRLNLEAGEQLDFLEKEVDMGFFDHHYFEIKDGVIQNNGCQRIHYCSCDCNHCSWGIF